MNFSHDDNDNDHNTNTYDNNKQDSPCWASPRRRGDKATDAGACASKCPLILSLLLLSLYYLYYHYYYYYYDYYYY